MEQLRLGWVNPACRKEGSRRCEVVVDEETRTRLIALMAALLIAVVRAAQEVGDDG